MIKQSRAFGSKMLAVAAALSFALATGAANAQHRHGGGGGGGHHGGGGFGGGGGGYHGGHRGGGGGAGVGIGIAAGLIGAAILAGAAANQHQRARGCRRPVYDDWGNRVGYRRGPC